jgi:hypothetical protein
VRLQPLGTHRNAVKVGQALPFSISDPTGRLLLARGQIISSAEQFNGLLERGALVDTSHLDDATQKIAAARPQELPALWDSSITQVGSMLRAGSPTEFPLALERASRPVMALIARDPDLAIFQVVRQDEGDISHYASRHAVHTAIASTLAARRLGWGPEVERRVFRAALTMNVSMVELQNRLANQVSPLTALQREAIQQHPERSVQVLEQSGVTDRDWLQAVARHHEHESGKGYPKGLTDVDDLAMLLQRSDVFTAKFSARGSRAAMAPDAAARQMFLDDQGNPMVAALIKEFGIYPPGSTVRLASGETGVVMRRGEMANAPVVVVVTSRTGEPLITPIPRDTAKPGLGVVGVVPLAAQKVRISAERLAKHLG